MTATPYASSSTEPVPRDRPSRSRSRMRLRLSSCVSAWTAFRSRSSSRRLEAAREFALECLRGSGDEASLRASHFAWALGLANEAFAEMQGPAQQVWVGRLEAEHANLRAALTWALEDCSSRAAALELAVPL